MSINLSELRTAILPEEDKNYAAFKKELNSMEVIDEDSNIQLTEVDSNVSRTI